MGSAKLQSSKFSENHPLFAGFLPAIPEKLSEKLLGYDTIVVIGAPAFTLHVAGTLSLKKSKIYQLTDDPQYAAQSVATKTLSGNIRDSLQALLDKLPTSMTPRSELDLPVRKPAAEVQGSNPISIEYVMATLAKYCPEDVVIVEEAPSHRPAIQRYLPITQPKSFYTMASGDWVMGYRLPLGLLWAPSVAPYVSLVMAPPCILSKPSGPPYSITYRLRSLC
nr:hypothetical protein [Psychrobacter sp. PraFG1]UNK06065.1 hypothetical protein MN210_05115 [Psychrobacter sp. PraFG1]